MDKDRQIRFLYPPLFFIGFWLWALYLDPNGSAQAYLPSTGVTEKSLDASQVAGIIASGGVAVLVAGFLISVVSVVVLRVAFAMRGHSTYEAVWTMSVAPACPVRSELGWYRHGKCSISLRHSIMCCCRRTPTHGFSGVGALSTFPAIHAQPCF